MSDTSGFPPFRAAAPKGNKTAAEPRAPLDAPSAHTAMFNDIVERVTVCAKCGSREVREALLVDGEVYVKL